MLSASVTKVCHRSFMKFEILNLKFEIEELL